MRLLLLVIAFVAACFLATAIYQCAVEAPASLAAHKGEKG